MSTLTREETSGAKLIAEFADRFVGYSGKLSMADIIDCACDDREITDEQEAMLLAHFKANPPALAREHVECGEAL